MILSIFGSETLILDVSKATIAIEAHSTEPWTAQAVKADGTLGTKYTFERPGQQNYIPI